MSRWTVLRSAVCLLAFAFLGLAPQLGFAEDRAAEDSAKLFGQLDANGDSAVSEDEVPADKQALFRRLIRTADKNGDGRLSRDEFVEGLKGREKPTPTAETSSTDKTGDAKSDAGKTGASAGDAGSGGGGPARLIARLDKNGDGRVTADEVPEAARERFKTMLGRFDKNKDGALSKDEAAAAPSAGGAAGSGQGGSGLAAGRDVNQLRTRLKEADKNGDGKLTKEEMPERLAPLFKRLDKNSDGQVDSQELRAGLEQMQNRAAKQNQKQKAAGKKAAQRRDAKQSAKSAKQNAKPDKSDGVKKTDADGNPA